MATKKKAGPPRKWVRLSNGQVEDENAVGRILLDLRGLALNNPAGFEALAQFVVGQADAVPDYLAARLRALKFAEPGSDPVALYDDVRDVVECCADWRGKRVRFNSDLLFHADQTKIVPPEDD